MTLLSAFILGATIGIVVGVLAALFMVAHYLHRSTGHGPPWTAT